jgi:hypothetical protein
MQGEVSEQEVEGNDKTQGDQAETEQSSTASDRHSHIPSTPESKDGWQIYGLQSLSRPD